MFLQNLGSSKVDSRTDLRSFLNAISIYHSQLDEKKPFYFFNKLSPAIVLEPAEQVSIASRTKQAKLRPVRTLKKRKRKKSVENIDS